MKIAARIIIVLSLWVSNIVFACSVGLDIKGDYIDIIKLIGPRIEGLEMIEATGQLHYFGKEDFILRERKNSFPRASVINNYVCTYDKQESSTCEEIPSVSGWAFDMKGVLEREHFRRPHVIYIQIGDAEPMRYKLVDQRVRITDRHKKQLLNKAYSLCDEQAFF